MPKINKISDADNSIEDNFNNITKLQKPLNERIKLHLSIISDFWGNFSQHLIHDWEKFFSSGKKISLQDIDNEMINFVHNSKKIIKMEYFFIINNLKYKKKNFSWSLQICTILLENNKYWIEWLIDDDQCARFFDSIASLQANLLCKIILYNLECLNAQMMASNVVSKF